MAQIFTDGRALPKDPDLTFNSLSGGYWVTTISYGRHRDWSLTEYICQQNNRNSLSVDGQSAVNLSYTPTQ